MEASLSESAQAAGKPARAPVSPALLLAGGAVLVFMTFMRYGLAELGWVAFAPFLVFLHEHGTSRRQLTLLATLASSWRGKPIRRR